PLAQDDTAAREVGDLLQNRVDLILVENREVLAVDRDLVTAILGKEHPVARLDAQLVPASIVENAPVAGRDDLAFLGLLLGAVGEVETAGGLAFGFENLNDDLVAEGFQIGHSL